MSDSCLNVYKMVDIVENTRLSARFGVSHLQYYLRRELTTRLDVNAGPLTLLGKLRIGSLFGSMTPVCIVQYR